jgi:cytochrome c biogenesis protein CcdA
MKRYDATFSSAMFVGSFVISASIMSAVHYDTFQNLESIWNWIMYLLGLMILMAGVKMLVSATTQQPLVQQEETATATAVDVAATGDTTDSTSTGGTNHPNRWTRSDELW